MSISRARCTFDGRLGIRFTRDHEIVVAYHDAVEAVLAASRAIGVAASMGEHAHMPNTWAALEQTGKRFDASHARFLAGAQSAVGSQLASKK